MTHRRARLLLYDHATGQLSDADRARLMEHLATCRPCADHLQRIQTAVRLLSPAASRPSERLAPEYWKGFARAVEQRVQVSAPPRERTRIGELLDELLFGRRRTLAIAGGALVTVVALSFLFRLPGPPAPPAVTEIAAVPGVSTPPPAPQVHQYLRRSRALLVGLENMDVPAKKAVDLRTEQKLSRELLQQAREFQGRPMDLHTARLVGDVERILNEIASAEQPEHSHFEEIRGGIRQENLLFKLRMAEAAYLQTASARGGRP